ncbi:unnamed protein product [Linum tenue]|uniref:Superoxide dismutase n=1 Tax=Linum tenue TaxID=586396 RepID=A0AAV0K956_9ROSI|nr:unnamed protein product [Linum tenue]
MAAAQLFFSPPLPNPHPAPNHRRWVQSSSILSRQNRVSAGKFITRANGGDMLGDFGARDPFPAEVESRFGEKVLGNMDTEHKILIPNISAMSLAQQECSPVSPVQPPMSKDDAQRLLKKVLGWRLLEEEGGLKLQCLWKLKDFGCGIELINRIHRVTEASGHFPNLHLEHPNQVRAELWTRTIGGLTMNDFIVAAKIDAIKTSDLAPRKRRRSRRMAGRVAITSKLELKPPPYPMDALEPHMSKETFEYHWGKHHRAYVDNLNKQIDGMELENMSLGDVVVATYNKGDVLPAFNNAAQAWNHEFFWESMKPGGGGKPSGELLTLIKRDFGSFEKFVQEFRTAASTQFGSGWAWLVYKANRLDVENAVNPIPSEEDKKLVVVKSPNAVNPLVWDYDHAYYLDFQNRRPDYISTFMEKLVSWEAVSARLEAAKARASTREEEEEMKKREEGDIGDSQPVEMYVDGDGQDDDSDD